MTTLLARARRGAAVAAAATLTLATGVYADVADFIPSDALAVLKGTDVQQVNDDVAALAREWGLDQFEPAFADPLAAFQEETGFREGIDFAGDVALYLPKNVDFDDDTPAHVLLVPISDFDAFRGNFDNSEEVGDGVFKVEMNGEPLYVADFGDHAAVSPVQDLVSGKPEQTMQFDGPTGQKIGERDLTLYANFAELGPMLQKAIDEEGGVDAALEEFGAEFADEVPEAMQAYRPVIEAGIRQAFAAAQGFLRDADAATVSVEFDPENGVGANVIAQFKDGSYLANTFGEILTETDNPLAGLPMGTYLAFGGGSADKDATLKLFEDLVGPAVEELREVDAPASDVFVEFVDAAKKAIEATEGQTFGYFAPAGAMGGGPLVQVVNIQRGDADALLEVARETAKLTPTLLSELQQVEGVEEAEVPEIEVVFTEDAREVAGVSFAKLTTDTGQDDPMVAMMTNMIFGPEGQTSYLGTVDGKLLTVSGLTDQQIEEVIAAVQAGDSPMTDAPGVGNVRDQLPDAATAVAYIQVGELARAGLGIAQAMAQAPPVQIPQDLPPVGVTLGPADDSIEIAAFVPKDLVSAMIVTALQVQGGAQGAPEGGL